MVIHTYGANQGQQTEKIKDKQGTKMFTPQRPPRGSTTSRSRPALRQVYQELQPTSEWKQEEGSAVLVVHVPGSYKSIYYLFHSSNCHQ